MSTPWNGQVFQVNYQLLLIYMCDSCFCAFLKYDCRYFKARLTQAKWQLNKWDCAALKKRNTKRTTFFLPCCTFCTHHPCMSMLFIYLIWTFTLRVFLTYTPQHQCTEAFSNAHIAIMLLPSRLSSDHCMRALSSSPLEQKMNI